VNGKVLCGISAASALVLGAVGGYFVARKHLEKQYEARLAAEIEATQAFIAAVHKTEHPTPEQAVAAAGREPVEGEEETRLVVDAARALVGYQGRGLLDRSKNVFQNEHGDDGVVPEAEVRARTEEAPYLISKDEFMENETEYRQATLTYFAGDKTLVDDREEPIVPITTVDEMVGINNLGRFGHFSGDPRVVYVRNDALDLEFEILLHDAKYAEEVAGFTGE